MKKYILILFVLFSFFQINQLHSQLRPYLQPIAGFDDGDGAGIGGGIDPVVDAFGNPICCENSGEFNFNIYFNDFAVLVAMENAIARAQRAAVERWLRQQEETFRKEINRQLGTSHTNFRDAQRAFFTNYEKNLRRVNSAASSVANQQYQNARATDNEQREFTAELFALNFWERNKTFCTNDYVSDPQCNLIRRMRIQGRWPETIRTEGDMNNIRGLAIEDFAKKEYDAGQYRSWGNSLNNLSNNDFFVNRFVNNHVAYYNGRGLQDKIFLMTAYLTQYYTRTPYINPNIYRIPNFWSNTTLLNLGKENAKGLSLDILVFNDAFLSSIANGQGPLPFSSLGSLINRRNNVINEHIDELPYLQLPQIGKGPKIDPKNELKCFDKTKPAKLTIYVEQAKPGTRELVGENQVGHAFIGIEQGQFRRVFGYYPQEDATRAGVALKRNYQAILRDNSGHNYDVKIEKNISALELTNIIQEAENFHPTYNLENYACADFGIEIGNLGNMNLPNVTYSGVAYRIYPFRGRLPGGLGEDSIESNTLVGNVTRENKKAPLKKGNCN